MKTKSLTLPMPAAPPVKTAEYRILLPLPPKGIGSNSRGHWSKKHRLIREYRQVCKWMFAASGIPAAANRVHLELDFYYHIPPECRGYFQTCRDESNALESVKAAVDAMQDAGIIGNDSHAHLKIEEVRIHGRADEHQGRTGVEFTMRWSA